MHRLSQRIDAYQNLLKCSPSLGSRDECMEFFCDQAWTALSPHGVSWLGFYLTQPFGSKYTQPAQQDVKELFLGPRRNKPACSPIGMHGVCGKAWLERAIQIVPDVHALGDEHIVCDPRNCSELVIPLYEKDLACWGVLDLDSFEKNTFCHENAEWLRRVLCNLQLTV